MFQSQEDYSEHSQGAYIGNRQNDAYAPSPQRKKRPTNMFKLFGRGSTTDSVENIPPSMFNFSQDSMASQSQFSQCSQDFTDRFQQCNVGGHGINSLAGADDSMIDPPSGGGSVDEYTHSVMGVRFSQADNVGSSQSQPQSQDVPVQDSSMGNGAWVGGTIGGSMYSDGYAERSLAPKSKPRGGFTNSRPAALDIPSVVPSSSASSSGSGAYAHSIFAMQSSLTESGTPLSALSTPLSTASSSGASHGIFFSSCIPPPPVNSSTTSMPPPAAVATKGALSSNNASSSSGVSLNRDVPASDKEKLLNLPPTMVNPFLQDENTFLSLQDGRNAPNGRKSQRRPTQSVYISAFKERPRCMFDFEQQGLLGEGVHSTVHRASRRLDGRSYAIKKLKRKIGGEKEGALLVREAMACAALQGCPHMVQYYGCWLEDGHLYLQLEVCPYGSLDRFVGSLMPTAHDMQVLTACQREIDRLQAGAGSDLGAGERMPTSDQQQDDGDGLGQLSHVSEFFYSCSQGEGEGEGGSEHGGSHEQFGGSVRMDDDGRRGKGADGGPLDTVLHYSDFGGAHLVRVGIDEVLAWVVLRDMSRALQFMHAKGLAHMDMRPANIFVARSPYATLPHMSLLSMQMQPGGASSVAGEANLHLTNPTLPQLQNLILQGGAVLRLGDLGQCCQLGDTLLNEGESRYLPREVLNESTGLDLAKSDVFSLGATVYELLLGRQLGAGGDTGAIEWHELRDGHFNIVVEQRYSSALVGVLRRMMHPNPLMRPTAVELYLEAAHYACASVSASASGGQSQIVRDFAGSSEAELHRLREENEQLRSILRKSTGSV
jgi:serine/threonine protein kinase